MPRIRDYQAQKQLQKDLPLTGPSRKQKRKKPKERLKDQASKVDVWKIGDEQQNGPGEP